MGTGPVRHPLLPDPDHHRRERDNFEALVASTSQTATEASSAYDHTERGAPGAALRFVEDWSRFYVAQDLSARPALLSALFRRLPGVCGRS